MAQFWLLGVFAVLCLMQGDALKCSQCVLQNPEETCEDTCEVSGEDTGCMVERSFDGTILKGGPSLSCYYKSFSSLCGTRTLTAKGFYDEFLCCSNEDFCNRKL